MKVTILTMLVLGLGTSAFAKDHEKNRCDSIYERMTQSEDRKDALAKKLAACHKKEGQSDWYKHRKDPQVVTPSGTVVNDGNGDEAIRLAARRKAEREKHIVVRMKGDEIAHFDTNMDDLPIIADMIEYGEDSIKSDEEVTSPKHACKLLGFEDVIFARKGEVVEDYTFFQKKKKFEAVKAYSSWGSFKSKVFTFDHEDGKAEGVRLYTELVCRRKKTKKEEVQILTQQLENLHINFQANKEPIVITDTVDGDVVVSVEVDDSGRRDVKKIKVTPVSSGDNFWEYSPDSNQ